MTIWSDLFRAYFAFAVIIVAVVVLCGYAYFQQYYQKTGRELKRIDSMPRSLLYSVSQTSLLSDRVCPADSLCAIFVHIQHFSESLSGLATIRAYGEANRFIKENEHRMDVEDRAYILYTSTQRVGLSLCIPFVLCISNRPPIFIASQWLAIRLDSIGALLILAVALLVAVGNSGISPSQVGLLLTYTVSLVQMMGMLTRQTAEVENNMNGAERIAGYTDHAVPQEAAYEREDTQPAKAWPEKGGIEMKDVQMSYRPG